MTATENTRIKTYEHILDIIGNGVIAIDHEGNLLAYNRKAQEIFGLIVDSGKMHPGGSLNPGDIVILADTGLGEDDGNLAGADLARLGILETALNPGDAFVAYGSIGGKPGSGCLMKVPQKRGVFEHCTVFSGIRLHIRMDFVERVVDIQVNQNSFKLPYVWSIGHMVALGAGERIPKFFQERGYTYRREDTKQLLYGHAYQAKGMEQYMGNLTGKHIFDIHPADSNPDIVSFCDAAKSGRGSYRNEVKEINGRMTRCSLTVWEKQAILQVEDITELDTLTKQRDSALAALEEREAAENDQGHFSRITGCSPAIGKVRRMARKAALSESHVLLLGESGTGKGLFAECIHRESRRGSKPFVYVNCASIPHGLLESELFGYEGGSFTGARKEGKPGLFEMADQGTIFLDEIGEIPLTLQVKLLHVIQDRRFMRVGGTKPIQVNTRIICATNQDLEAAVQKNLFRSDLYYRINVLPIRIPPLRERPEDLSELIASMVPAICSRAGVPEKGLSQGAKRIIYQYEWPGNVRELENVLERGVNTADHDLIQPEHLGLRFSDYREPAADFKMQTLAQAVETAEGHLFRAVLEQVGGNRHQAMEILGIKKTLFYEKLKRYGL